MGLSDIIILTSYLCGLLMWGLPILLILFALYKFIFCDYVIIGSYLMWL